MQVSVLCALWLVGKIAYLSFVLLVTRFLDSVIFLLYNLFLKKEKKMAYDPRAVKLPKSVKRRAATILDAHERGAVIRSFVKILEAEQFASKNRNNKKDKQWN